MKQRDIALFIVVGVFSVVLSLVFSSLVIKSPKQRSVKVEIVEPITAEFNEPDDTYFNKNSINPTKIIEIEDNKNKQPFSKE